MKLIRCATMALFLFLPALAQAQTFPCEPATQFNMSAPGTAASQASGVVLNGKDIGDWSVYWCPMPTGKWRLVSHAVLTKYRNTLNWQAAFWSVVNAPDRLAALEELAVRSRIVPAAGTVDEYEWKTLLYQACKAATYPPFLGASKNGVWLVWFHVDPVTNKLMRVAYVGTPAELSKVGGRIATILKSTNPLQMLQTAGSRFPILPLTDPSLAAVVADMEAAVK